MQKNDLHFGDEIEDAILPCNAMDLSCQHLRYGPGVSVGFAPQHPPSERLHRRNPCECETPSEVS